MAIRWRRKGKGHFEELSIAITLLAGISAVLWKLIEYTNQHVLEPNIYYMIYIFVVGLVYEAVIILLFLLICGLLIWSLREKEKILLKELYKHIRRIIFLFPAILLIYVFIEFFALFLLKILSKILETYTSIKIDTTIFLTIFLTILLLGLLTLLVAFSIPLILSSIKSCVYLIKPNTHSDNKKTKAPTKTQFTGTIQAILLIIALLLTTTVFVTSLLQISLFLSCGSYSIEEIKLPNNEISFAIKDTGTPSGKCWVTLYQVLESNNTIFQEKDFVILNSSANSSKYLLGIKKDGIYYLFLKNTSQLHSGKYLLHAEVTYKDELFKVFTCRKTNNYLFYIS